MLYENDFYLVREDGRGDLLAESQGLLEDPGAESSHGRGRGLEILTISFDSRWFDAHLDGFTAWIWRVAAALEPAHAFLAAGSDTEYGTRERRFRHVMYESLPAVVARGELEVIHPVMYFAERVPVRPPRPPWQVETRAGLGALWSVIYRNGDGALEVPEPGSQYPALFAAATERSAPGS